MRSAGKGKSRECILSDVRQLSAHNHLYHRTHNMIIMLLLNVTWSRGSSVGIVLDKQGIVVLSSAGGKTFIIDQGIPGRTQSPIQWVLGALPNLEKRPGCESDQSPRLVPSVRMSGAIPLLPLYAFMARTATN